MHFCPVTRPNGMNECLVKDTFDVKRWNGVKKRRAVAGNSIQDSWLELLMFYHWAMTPTIGLIILPIFTQTYFSSPHTDVQVASVNIPRECGLHKLLELKRSGQTDVLYCFGFTCLHTAVMYNWPRVNIWKLKKKKIFFLADQVNETILIAQRLILRGS